MDNNFSPGVREVIAMSKETALEFQNDFIDTAHLVLAIISHGSLDIFKELNIDLSKIKKEISSGLFLKSSADSSQSIDSKKSLHLTRQAEKALKTSFLQAKLEQADIINNYHLLLCVLRDENDETTQILNSEDLDYESVLSYHRENMEHDLEEEGEGDESNPFVDLEKDFKFEYIRVNDSRIITEISKRKEGRIIKILEMKALDVLYFKVNRVTQEELDVIRGFSNLEELEILATSDLIEDYSFESFFKEFKKLKKISLTGCDLNDVSFLKNITSLERLILSHNKIIDIESVKNLKHLKYIDVSHNKILSINCLERFIKNKATIFFQSNPINKISEKLVIYLMESNVKCNLEGVRLMKTFFVNHQEYENAARYRDYEKTLERIDKLPESSELKFKKINREFFFNSIPITVPPLEIVIEGVKDVRSYFLQFKKDKTEEYLYEGKLLVIGEGGVGKTSFVRKIKDSESDLPKENETTFNINVTKLNFEVKNLPVDKIYINAWDFGGQKVYRGTHQLFFSDKCLYVLIDDNRQEKTDFSYWINTVQQLAGEDSSLIIVLNQKHERRGTSFDESGYKSQFGKVIKDVIEIDLEKDTYELDLLRDIIKKRFIDLPLIGKPLPSSWIKIREVLSNIEENYISYDKFKEICHEGNVKKPSDIETLSSYFDNVGVFTHYSEDPLLRERVYLDSNWLVETLYKVLDNDIISEKKGIIDMRDVDDIWKDEELDFEVDRLCLLMNKYGLMYRVAGKSEFVIPERLPTKMPYDKWTYESSSNLKFKYEFDKYNPRGLMSKLMVSLHRYIKNQDLIWHRGVNIQLEDTHAEIIETYSVKNSFEIKIYGDNKKALLAIIIEKFDELLSVYNNLTYDKLIQCNCKFCKDSESPYYFPYKDLLRRREREVLTIECLVEYEQVNVTELLDGLEREVNSKMKKINIFLASSNELEGDRTKFEQFIRRENKKMIDKGIFLDLHIWEDFIDSMSKERLQSEYNKVARESDIFISLFGTKVGKYTEEEFDVCYKSFIEKNCPKYIYTYFKNIKTGISEIKAHDFKTLTSFKEKLGELGHFFTGYEDENDLTRQIKLQFDKILKEP
tara:strand:- start:2153 stop:5404 length:3252 start_codon:yes stop_codon:yes gene_type:complete